MALRDTLQIFTPDQINNLTENNIKNLKREFLLEFQLTNETTIKFNNIELDKNQVVLIFEKLISDYYHIIEDYYQNIVSDFIEHGDIRHLSAHGHKLILNIVENDRFRDKLLRKTSLIISDLLKISTDDRKQRLTLCREITSALPKEYENRAYAESVRYLRTELDAIKSRYRNPFRDNSTLHFEPELMSLINIDITELFLLLPEQYHFLAYEYALWCEDFVINLCKFREKNWKKYPLNSLLVLKEAASIANQFYNKKELEDILRDTSILLQNPEKIAKKWKKKKKKKKESMNTEPALKIIFIIVIYIIVVLITREIF